MKKGLKTIALVFIYQKKSLAEDETSFWNTGASFSEAGPSPA